jgi:hypothetical protein
MGVIFAPFLAIHFYQVIINGSDIIGGGSPDLDLPLAVPNQQFRRCLLRPVSSGAWINDLTWSSDNVRIG